MATKLWVKAASGQDAPAEWKSSRTITSPGKLTFRWSTTDKNVDTVRWIVTGSDGKSRIADGTVLSKPGAKKSGTFTIEFAKFAPTDPPNSGMTFKVFARTRNAQKGGTTISTSPAVTVKYKKAPAPDMAGKKEREFIPSIKLQFQGLWCVEESDEVGDDEIYIVALMFFDNGDGQVRVHTAQVPSTGAIEEVATGDKVLRKDTVFLNQACELSVVIILVEEDHSDGMFTSLLENAVLAQTAREMANGVRAKDMAATVVSSVPDTVLTMGLNDNEIIQAKVALSMTKEQVLKELDSKPFTSGPFIANFQTTHKGDTAEYRLFFRLLKL